MTLLEKLRTILHRDCFRPSIANRSALIVEEQRQSIDLSKKKKWKQITEIKELDGDEFFISFDGKNHKTYSPYLIGKQETLTAKACDYIMFKPEAGRWTIVMGELKLGTASFSANSISDQIGGSLAFLEYVKVILKLQYGCHELDNAKIQKRVIYKEKMSRCRGATISTPKRKNQSGRKRVLSPIVPLIVPFAHPRHDIIKIGLPFDDDKFSCCSLTLNEFLGRG
ncbi:hypothetical protein RX455_000266 [Vibrio fluvialis]|nr:hypothetical protein [Vibrio fluvialis]